MQPPWNSKTAVGHAAASAEQSLKSTAPSGASAAASTSIAPSHEVSSIANAASATHNTSTAAALFASPAHVDGGLFSSKPRYVFLCVLVSKTELRVAVKSAFPLT